MLHSEIYLLSWVSIEPWRSSSAFSSSSSSSSYPTLLSLPPPPPMKSNPKLPQKNPPSTNCSTSRTPHLSFWIAKESTRRRERMEKWWGRERSRSRTWKPGLLLLSLSCFLRVLFLLLVRLLATMRNPIMKESPFTAIFQPQNRRVLQILLILSSKKMVLCSFDTFLVFPFTVFSLFLEATKFWICKHDFGYVVRDDIEHDNS